MPDTRLVVRWIEAHNSRDLEGMLACAQPEVEFHPLRLVGGASSVYVGSEGLRLWFGELRRARIDHALGLAELRETADDKAVATGSVDLPGSPNTTEFFGIYRFVDGLIASAHHYISDRRTMENVGQVAGPR